MVAEGCSADCIIFWFVTTESNWSFDLIPNPNYEAAACKRFLEEALKKVLFSPWLGNLRRRSIHALDLYALNTWAKFNSP
jgi:hypothetical protein